MSVRDPLSGRGDEARVVAGFKRHLESNGWNIAAVSVGWADIVAVRGDERLVAEAKGYTGASAGLDVDTMYGQLLRRMGSHTATTWAIVVPTRSLPAALRVPVSVRDQLGIRVFEVADDGAVLDRSGL